MSICRDCADTKIHGICDNDGMPCDPEERKKLTADEGYLIAMQKYQHVIEEKDREIEALKEEAKEYRRLYFKQCRDSSND